MKLIVLFIFIICFCLPLFATDFGAIINCQFNAEKESETSIGARTTAMPWLLLPVREMDFYLSAGAHIDYGNPMDFIPELFRLELSARLSDSLSLRIGRLSWQDASRFTAGGTFDGADLLVNLDSMRLGAAVLYTGLQYKETAKINPSPGTDYSENFSWDDFSGTYFAPPRVVASLYGEFPAFPYERGQTSAALLTQFDLSDAPEAYHSQYLVLRHSLVYMVWDFNFAAAVQAENTEMQGFRTAYALSAEAGVQLPGDLRDRLSLGVRWASGEGSSTAAFFPIIREAQGTVLKPHLSGIMVIRANYQARILPSLSAEIGGRYLLRTDETSFIDPEISGESHSLGAELDGNILWAPFPDLSVSLAGGIFLPKTGSAFNSETPVRWTITLGTIFSF